MYQLYVTNQAKKDLKRLDSPIIKIVLSGLLLTWESVTALHIKSTRNTLR